MKYALLGMLLCASGGAWAMAVPHSAGLDPRMQQVSYSAHNTTQINAKLGYLTSLVFDEGEEVLSTKTGFDAGGGWEVSFEHNVIYVLARPVVQEQEDGEGNKVKQDSPVLLDALASTLKIPTAVLGQPSPRLGRSPLADRLQ